MINAALTPPPLKLQTHPGGITKPPSLSSVLSFSAYRGARHQILFVTSELADLVKTGGLGEVAAALPRALQNSDVRILIPGYKAVMAGDLPIIPVGQINGYAGIPPCQIGCLTLPDGLIVYVVINADLYQREGTPYCDPQGRDWKDNAIRFAALSLAAVEIAAGNAQLSWCPDLLHCHDWPTGLVPAYIQWRNLNVPTVFTIHNLGYQGILNMRDRHQIGIPDSACQMEEMEFYGQLSLLKAGIAYAHHVTTVSITYAKEITTPEFGFGLDGFLRKKAAQGLLSGICNGIDDSWDPQADPHLLQGFDIREWQGKRRHAEYVRQRLNLHPSEGPLFGVVSRLVQQKGFDLTMAVARDIVLSGGQIAIIGCGEPQIERELQLLADQYPGNIGIYVGFNDTEAHRIYAGSDFLLMPSRYEPCGLSQMYAQRFGCLPIARNTGGLADTIEDGLTGFLFNEATVTSYRQAIRRALRTYRYPILLNAMRCRAMSAHFFWRHSTKPYEMLYDQLLGKQKQQDIMPQA